MTHALLLLVTLAACDDKDSSDDTAAEDTGGTADDSGDDSGDDGGEDDGDDGGEGDDVYVDIQGTWAGDVTQADGLIYVATIGVDAGAEVDAHAGTFSYYFADFDATCEGELLRATEAGAVYTFVQHGNVTSQCLDGTVTLDWHESAAIMEFMWEDFDGNYDPSTGTLVRTEG
jgi:hypothetical protein